MSSLKKIRKEEFPDMAGAAELCWDEEHTTPSREGNDVYIPEESIVFDSKTWNHPCLYFGGTDEQPFLVELELEVMKYLLLGGEDGFFEALKPEIIVWAEKQWGSRRTLRQGDIFAYPVPVDHDLFSSPFSKDLWSFILTSIENGVKKIVVTSVLESELFGTRHKFSGLIAGIEINQTDDLVIAEGVIEAPDHASLHLNGPHLLAQADFLVSPQKAD